MSTMRLETCPLCGCDDLEGSPFPSGDDRWIVRCGNPGCNVEVRAGSDAVVAAKWNRRSAPAQNAQGDGEVIGYLNVSRFRHENGMVNYDFDYTADLPDGNYKLYLHAERARVPELMMERLADAAAALDKLGRRDQCRHLMMLHEMLAAAPSQPGSNS